jgi:UDP-N-acetylmuramoyl-L-alanyl-D-glutamate--2,6-diaminopimelate ligase
MRLSELLKEIQYTRLVMPKEEVDVLGVNIDSRLVQNGDMFIAVRGTQTDGHAYIASAEEKGAVAIVCEEMPEKQNHNIAYIVLPNA